MTPEEFVKVCEDFNELKSVQNGLKYDLAINILKTKYTQTQMYFYKIQEGMKNGKQYNFSLYRKSYFIKNLVKVINPITESGICNNLSIFRAESYNGEIIVEYENKNGEIKTHQVPYNSIKEYVDPESIDPKEYKF